MATTRLLPLAVLVAGLVGCGSREDPSLAAPADKTAGAVKGPPVTKPSGEKMDVDSATAAANEERGG